MPRRIMRLHGKKVTEEDIIREITWLLRGDNGRDSISVSDIAQIFGCSRQTVYNHIKKAVGKYQTLEYKNGRVLLPEKSELEKFRQFDKNHEIVKDPLVEEWKQDLLTRRRGANIYMEDKNTVSRISLQYVQDKPKGSCHVAKAD